MVATELTDAELLDRARDGDEAAFTALYVRHHGAIARLAASYRSHEPDDLVDATFGQVVAELRRRSGPTEAFRAYLFATVHARVVEQSDLARRPQRPVPEPIAALAARPALGGADRVMITRAYESLPDHWQVPLWHTVVLGCDPAELAGALEVPLGTALRLDRYAGHKLRQAFLQAHLDAAPRPGCEPHRERLTAHLRGSLDSIGDDEARNHVERCNSCRDLMTGLQTAGELLARSVVPFFPTAAAPSSVPMPLGAPGSVAIEVAGEQPAVEGPVSSGAYGDGSPRVGAATAGTGWGALADSPDVGDTSDDDLAPRGRGAGLAPKLGGAAAAVVLIGGLAVFGTALAREDGGRGSDAALGGDARPPGGDVDTGDTGDAGRPGGETPADPDDRDPTTTTDRDDERAGDDEERDGDSPVRSRSGDGALSLAPAARPSAPPDTTPGRSVTGPTSPPATSTPPTTRPTDPDPGPALVSWQVGWTPASDGTGTLRVTVASPSDPGGVDTQTVQVTVRLSAGAQLSGTLDSRCRAATGGATCAIPAPTPGASTTAAIGLAIDGAGQTATVSARQGTASLGAHTVDLTVPSAPAAADPGAAERAAPGAAAVAGRGAAQAEA
jgi:DNA-directed RNA polymerase specialized sigma24 family protein